MKVMTFKLECPGCKFTQALKTQRPGLLDALILTLKCETCESDLMVKVTRPPKGNRAQSQVSLSSKVMKPSAKLLELQAEDAQLKAEVQAENARSE